MTLPEWLNQNRYHAKRSKRHEQRLAAELDGKRVAQSGARRWSPKNLGEVKRTEGADVNTKRFSIEHKFTGKKSLSLKKEWLDKIRETARIASKMPAVIVTFDAPRGPPEDWVLIPKEIFQRLLKAWDDE